LSQSRKPDQSPSQARSSRRHADRATITATGTLLVEMVMRILLAAAALAGAASTGAAPAAAEADRIATGTIEVRHGDLDLGRASDVARLDRRIGVAVRRVCGAPDSAGLAARMPVTDCRTSAEAGARIQRDLAIANAQRAGGSRHALAGRR
jgi:UrcA family protein